MQPLSLKPANQFLVVLLLGLGAALSGVVLGALVVKLPLALQLLGVLLIAGGGVWLMIRVPALTVVIFYLTYILLNSVLWRLSFPEGLYYPIYLIMVLNIFLLLLRGRLSAPWPILGSYALFYGFTILGLSSLSVDLDRDVWQRLFILGLGFLVFFQFQSLKSARLLMNTKILVGFVLSIWVITSSVQTQFAYRGGVINNQNLFAFFLAFAVVAVVAKLLSQQKSSFLLQILSWLSLALLIYGLFLFASRGLSIATAAAVLVMLSRVLLKPRVSVPLVVGTALVATTVLNLPGSQGLLERFAGDDLAGAGGRLGIWSVLIREFLDSSPLEIVFGQGFNASRALLEGSAHNGYLLVLTDSGIVGLLLFLSIHLVVVRFLWAYSDTVSLYAVGAVVVLMLASLTGTFIDNFIYWVVTGHVLAITSLRREVLEHKQIPRSVPSEPGTRVQAQSL